MQCKRSSSLDIVCGDITQRAVVSLYKALLS
jgi:hypothetical protein